MEAEVEVEVAAEAGTAGVAGFTAPTTLVFAF